LHELETQALIARQLGYLAEGAATNLETRTIEIGKMLNGLINSMRQARADD
jgi:four helix bundle protein